MDSLIGILIGMGFLAGTVVFGFLLVLIYFVPTFVAYYRGHRNLWPLFILNIVFAGTGIGWLVLLIWALLDQERTNYG